MLYSPRRRRSKSKRVYTTCLDPSQHRSYVICTIHHTDSSINELKENMWKHSRAYYVISVIDNTASIIL
ncbi:hypothetical protein GYH30_038656 [Glycine max]|uniref:Uncharacterized protein n=1 Tax=Glycine max TaxID=3847 RepID=A0A0R0G769_SOYBN|nr:hypothetical protein GYH30_038656 [Glycine max]